MNSRREFLKEAAAGVALLGAESKLALAAQDKHAGKSRVVIVHDKSLRGPAGDAPEEARVAAILDRAMEAYFQQKNPITPWKQIVHPNQVVSLKVNTIAGKGLSTHVALVNAICERLQQSGVRPGNIIVWDRTNHELEAAGFKIATDTNHVRCFGTDSVGYEDAVLTSGMVKTQLSKIVTQSDVIINVPVLKHHGGAGITMAMKNMYGVIKNPSDQHGNNCNPYVADLNTLPELHRKLRFVVGDIFTCVYAGGPRYKPEYAWNHNQLIVGEDHVAIDYLGWQIIEKKRAEKGLKSLEDSHSAPRYIATAADSQHKLGTNDPGRILLTELSIA
ncbi:MAG: DUF362 domain-containing protein [Acidobacteriaceae bacterium]|nr:DUF362 domain-containing protein [Acidobacteriaceae bacterium]